MVDKEQFLVFGIAVTSSFVHAFESLIVKQISSLSAIEMAFMRMVVQTIILVPICQYRYTIMGMDTNKLTSLRPLYMGIIENVAPKRST